MYSNRCAAAFDGNDRIISKLFIKGTARSKVGLFGSVGTGGRIESLVVRRRSVAGLAGSNSVTGRTARGTVTNSCWDTGATGQSTSDGGGGKTTRELQSPTGCAGICANWNANLDSIAGNDAPWDFGANRPYPVLKYGGPSTAPKRQTSIRSDNWNAPRSRRTRCRRVAYSCRRAAYRWSSRRRVAMAKLPTGAIWTDIAGATTATHIPGAADAASGGRLLRAQATFAVAGSIQTLTAVNTAKVAAANTAATGGTLAATPVAGQQLRCNSPSYAAAGSANRRVWRWPRCDDAAINANCKLRAQTHPAPNAHTEYTPVAGAGADAARH